MNTTPHEGLPCEAVGHNYVKLNTYGLQSTLLKCQHCGTVRYTDPSGDFNDSDIPNPDLKNTLRQLFHLRLKKHKSRLKYSES